MTQHRIAIVGPGGSGKTTLASKLSQRLGLPAVHLDEHLSVARRYVSEPEQRRRVAELLSGDVWIVEGAGWRVLDLLFTRATVIVVTDPPFRRSFPRLARREMRRRWGGWTLRTLKDLFDFHHMAMWACHYPLVERRRVFRAACAAQNHASLIVAKTFADAEPQIESALRPQ